MSYELAIVLFVVLAGLLFIDLGWSFLFKPFVELVIFLGIVMLALGWGKRDYDLFFTGIVFIVGALAMLSAMPGLVPTPPESPEGITLNVLWPVVGIFQAAYALGPIVLGILVLLLAWALSRIR